MENTETIDIKLTAGKTPALNAVIFKKGKSGNPFGRRQNLPKIDGVIASL